MEIIISQGDDTVNVSLKTLFREPGPKELAFTLIRCLTARHKYISRETAIEHLQQIKEMLIEILPPSSDLVLISRRINRYCDALSKMQEGSLLEKSLWDFMLALDGYGNLNGFGFCMMPFKDAKMGNAEKISLYEMAKRERS